MSRGALRPGASIAARVVAWQQQHGRHDLPWHGSRDPYRVWLSEIMLQQTQVSTVLGYYPLFLARFRTVRALAAAAVERPMPGKVSNSAAESGKRPPCTRMTSCAQRCRLRARL